MTAKALTRFIKFRLKYPVGTENVSYDGVPADRGQCVQLVALYAQQVIKVPLPSYPDAATYWEKPVPGYQKITRKPGLTPKYGDIVIFGRTLPGSENHGHIDICISTQTQNKKTSTFTGLDSNWEPLTITRENHDYQYVLGWLRV